MSVDYLLGVGGATLRELNMHEISQLGFLSERGIEYGLVQPTKTALGKSIMDAVAPLREYLRNVGVHDYAHQPKGPDSKRLIPTRVVGPTGQFESEMTSMYRPITKDGDPRIWITGLAKIVSPDDILVVINRDGLLYVVDITVHTLGELVRSNEEFADLVSAKGASKLSAVSDLLVLLREIAGKGFIRTQSSADTTVGMLLESELGIQANSSKSPDYRGIEIKAARGGRANRHNLFAKVPDWATSPIGSSRTLLQEFGYQRDGRQQLYCTISSRGFNSQGLILRNDETNGQIVEASNNPKWPIVAVWATNDLMSALETKHADTFWVRADSRVVDGEEEIRFSEVVHTSSPILSQLAPLIGSGHVTVDHLVREKNGAAAERGPLFKLKSGSLDLLFPPSRRYEL